MRTLPIIVFAMTSMFAFGKTKAVSVCKVNDFNATGLDVFQKHFHRNGSCSLKNSASFDLVTITQVIVVHSVDDTSCNYTHLIKELSLCGVTALLVNLSDLNSVKWPQCCSLAEPVFVLYCGANIFEELADTDNCSTLSASDKHLAIGLFASNCRNTIWLNTKRDIFDFERVFQVYVVEERNNFDNLSDDDTDFETSIRLKGKTLRVATLPAAVGPMSQMNIDNGTATHSGVVIEVLDFIARRLEFKYTIVTPPDNQYGVQLDNGSVTGLVGMLQRQEVDVAASDLAVTYGRSQIIDLSLSPFYHSLTGIMLHAPNSRPRLDLWKWSSAFSPKLWLCFLGALVVACLVIYGSHLMFHPDVWIYDHFKDFINCFMYLFSGYINQGGISLSPLSWWGQTLLTFWWLICLVEVACYGSFLIATLTAPNPVQLPFSDIEGLARSIEKGEYKACLRDGTSLYQEILADHKNGSHWLSVLNNWLKHNPQYLQNTLNGCLDLILTDQSVVFIAEVFFLEAYQRIYCNNTFIILQGDFHTLTYSFGFQKNSSYTKLFANEMINIAEQGLVDLWYQNYTRSQHQYCSITDASDFGQIYAQVEKLSLHDLFSVFVLLCLGILVSVVGLLLEHCIRRKQIREMQNRVFRVL